MQYAKKHQDVPLHLTGFLLYTNQYSFLAYPQSSVQMEEGREGQCILHLTVRAWRGQMQCALNVKKREMYVIWNTASVFVLFTEGTIQEGS